MIAKRAPRRRDSKSSFTELARYILDLKNAGQKVDGVRVSNCLSDTELLAIKEIEATQALNRRTKNDKTYHLIVSFRAEEKPTAEQLSDIEDEICQSIGLGAHQRIRVVHNDTDNLHMHLAINKIHPGTHNCIEPYYDHFKLDETCRQLEQKHGLQVDNRIDRGERAQGKAGDMEAHSGVESFESWVKGEPAEVLKAMLEQPQISWDQVQETLAQFDLEVRKRGAGFVIADRNRRLFVKSSTILRAASKKGLESKLGSFVAAGAKAKAIKARIQYQKKPLHRDPAKEALYRRYEREKTALKLAKKAAMEAQKTDRDSRAAALRGSFSMRSQQIRDGRHIASGGRRRLYQDLAVARKEAFARLRDEDKAARQALHSQYRVQNWQEFLIDEALGGNDVALRVLRSRPNRAIKGRGTGILSGVEKNPIIYDSIDKNIRKNGDVVYRFGDGGSVRDEGDCLRIDGTNRETLFAALQMSIQKYGSTLDVDGTEDFKRQIIAVSGEMGLPVKFKDRAQERVRDAIDRPPPRKSIDRRRLDQK